MRIQPCTKHTVWSTVYDVKYYFLTKALVERFVSQAEADHVAIPCRSMLYSLLPTLF